MIITYLTVAALVLAGLTSLADMIYQNRTAFKRMLSMSFWTRRRQAQHEETT